MPTLAAILSNLVSVVAALGMIVLLLAGGANASPETITRIKWMSIGVGAVTMCAVAVSAWLASHGPNLARRGRGPRPPC